MSLLTDRIRARPWLPILLAALLYGGLHLVWYWQTPLGASPVLDERENLDLARQIASGALPAEPFYRAMGYPLLLALFPALGLPDSLQPFAATGLGLLLHGLGSVLVALIARRLFGSVAAALVAGLGHALHPVLVHYATQILDGALANVFFLLGLLALLPRTEGAEKEKTPSAAPASPSAPTARGALLSAAAWSAAALVRPQFLVLLPCWPPLWLLLRGQPLFSRAHLRPFALAAASVAALFGALTLWQHSVSGEFRLQPTQGPYNLWAANRPGADGRYFVQSLHLPFSASHQNPTLVESRLLYERETGLPATTMDEVNRHWSAQLRAAVAADPLGWLRLTARKAYYLLNDFDAYNNKTYAFHQARSPWLAPNPLGWGVLFVAAVPGFLVLAARRPREALALAVLFAVVAGGVLLTYVSGRFRPPLTALLCVCCGGLAHLSVLGARRRIGAALAMLGVTGLTFSNFADARDTRTFLQDELLLASAAVSTGDDRTAWQASSAALAMSPAHPDAPAWLVTSGFNRLLRGPLPPDDMQAWTRAASLLLATRTDDAAPAPPTLIAIAGYALWQAGDRAAARELWLSRWQNHQESASLAALELARRLGRDADASTPPTLSPLDASAGSFGMMLRAWDASPPSEHDLVLRELSTRLFPPSQPAPVSP